MTFTRAPDDHGPAWASAARPTAVPSAWRTWPRARRARVG